VVVRTTRPLGAPHALVLKSIVAHLSCLSLLEAGRKYQSYWVTGGRSRILNERCHETAHCDLGCDTLMRVLWCNSKRAYLLSKIMLAFKWK
jgi:hypothetical protein